MIIPLFYKIFESMKNAVNIFLRFQKYIILIEIYAIFIFLDLSKVKKSLFYPYKYLEKRISYVLDYLN